MLTPVKVDYHLHSRCSDGKLPPEQVVQRAAEAGLREIAITDHNTLAHIQPAQEAADKLGILLIKGCEITASVYGTDFHILAYGFTRMDPLKNFFERERKKQEKRAKKTAQKLSELGWYVDLDRILQAKEPETVLGRLIIVRFILTHPQNAERLLQEKIKEDEDFYVRYLRRGCPAYVVRKKPGIRRVVRLIKLAGGLAVWAHPIWTLNEYYEQETLGHLSQNFKRMRRAGIDGVEVFYPSIRENLAIALYNMCWKKKLLVTGGSDWHGEDFRKGEISAPGKYPVFPSKDPVFPGKYPVFNGIQPDVLSKILANR